MDGVCPICGSDVLVHSHERGETICAVCGTVVSENIVDLGPDWRAIDADEKLRSAHAGPPITRLTAEELMTMIDNKVLDRELDSKRKLEIIRLRTWQKKVKVQTSFERNLVEASKELERLRSAMGLPKPCVERALELYRRVLMKELNKGRSIDTIAAAVLYAACRMLKTPRSLDEFAKYVRSPRKSIASFYRLIIEELKIKMPMDDPILHIPRIAGQLNLSGDVVKTAMEILQKARRKRLTAGKDPVGLAAAILYLAAKIHGIEKTQKEFAAAAGVTEVTLRNSFKEIAKALDIKIQIPPAIDGVASSNFVLEE